MAHSAPSSGFPIRGVGSEGSRSRRRIIASRSSSAIRAHRRTTSFAVFRGECTLRAVGLLTFGLNVTLDGCQDHREGIADEELHDYFTQLMDEAGAMMWGRVTYELMESAWPAVARDENAPRAMRDWARKLEDKPKYVVSASRRTS